MTTLKQVLSLEDIILNKDLEAGYSTLSLGAGKGKTYKGISWGVETSITNNLKGTVFVTSEMKHSSLKEFYQNYVNHGNYGVEAESLEFIIITTYDGETDLEVLVDRLNYIKGQHEYCLVLDDVMLDNRTKPSEILEALEESGGKFNEVLVTHQLNHSFN